jgi:hypothetical protein
MEFFMKKSILASSIAAAVFGLGATGAQAQQFSVPLNAIGDILLVPYYTAQAENATLLSITNTDIDNGKAVKVRFRGAANSDDVFDFQVFLSPGDVWTANISKGADGRAVLTTSDKSCTKPNALSGTSFLTVRLDPSLTGDALANGTREGYVEIITMANIPKAGTTNTSATVKVNPLYTAVKHVNGVAPCSGTAWEALDTLPQGSSSAPVDYSAVGLTEPSGGLMGNWTIINTVNSAAWGGQATALNHELAQAATKTITYYSQVNTPVVAPQDLTADPLFLAGNFVHAWSATTQALANTSVTTVAAITAPGLYDLPDLSTPGTTATVSPTAQVVAIQQALAKTSVIAEFATESAIAGSTDWVFSMPSRRYAVAMAYSKISASDDGRRFNAEYQGTTDFTGNKAAGQSPTAAFNGPNTSVINRLICVSGAKPVAYDREERTATTTVVVSPSVLGKQQYCGEVSVFAFNNGSASAALKASVAVSAVDVTYSSGWATLNTTVTGTDLGTPSAPTTPSILGLPLLGGAFMKASNGAQGYGVTQAYRYSNAQ